MDAEKRKWWEKDFVKAYQAYKTRDLKKLPPPKLEGIFSRENKNAGYLPESTEPKRIAAEIKRIAEGDNNAG